VNLRWSIDAIADFGGVFRLSPVYDLYVGVYGSYGFMDVLPKAADKKDFISPEHNKIFAVNSLLATNFLGEYNKYVKANNLNWKSANEKWNRWQVGIKVGVHIKPCKIGKTSRERSLRDTQREFYNRLPEYMSNVGRTVIIRDTIHVVYVHSAVPENGNFTPAERESVSALVNIFKNSKILFDLDSDIPKIEEKNFIADAAKVLQEGRTLSLIVEGYTCDLGTEEHNRNLANRRANAIRDLFIAQGVSPSQIQVAAYTANDPQSKVNITEECREEHRAVIFKIVKR
jgi:outer membrane protein OmpA-like peptidoglycan-associated protein